MENKISPFAPKNFPKIPAIDGVEFATGNAGIKYRERDDFLLVKFCKGTIVGGVFTQSKCPAAPIDWCKKLLADSEPRALLVNSGNANAFTGQRGVEAAKLSAKIVAQNIDCKPEEVFLASTGVIGEYLDAQKFNEPIKRAVNNFNRQNLLEGARAIMTTDTYPKIAYEKIKIDNVEIILAGIAKGSGMIAPNMATMLGFIFTDMAIEKNILQSLLKKFADNSFNAITVDSDCSTSDTLMIFATNEAQKKGVKPIIEQNDERLSIFALALEKLMKNLALQIVKDGEGISKLIKISVFGAANNESAKKIALSIGNSPLVKTAIAGEDANWGRVVMAVGKAGERANRDRISIYFGDIEVARNGEVSPNYREELGADYMKNSEIAIKVDVGVGAGEATIYASDLTHDYISINADYRS